MYDKVRLLEYLNEKCPYGGCKWNDGYGVCLNEDEDFLTNIKYLTSIDKANTNIEINCIPKIQCGYCPYCGSKLERHIERYPYGDTTVPYTYYECPDC